MFPLFPQLTTTPLTTEMTPRLLKISQNLSWSLLVKTNVATKAWFIAFYKINLFWKKVFDLMKAYFNDYCFKICSK